MEKVYNSGKKEGAVMSYIKEHLNWTLFLGVLIVELPLIILLLFPQESLISFPNFFWIIIPTVLLELSLEVWYLHQKNRSYWFILFNFIKPFYIPVGFIVLLSLGNYRD